MTGGALNDERSSQDTPLDGVRRSRFIEECSMAIARGKRIARAALRNLPPAVAMLVVLFACGDRAAEF